MSRKMFKDLNKFDWDDLEFKPKAPSEKGIKHESEQEELEQLRKEKEERVKTNLNNLG